MRPNWKSRKGFSMVEMLVAMAAGLVILGAVLQLFSKGMNATWKVSQRAEMQQDGRAAIDLLARDISMAGAGLQTGAALASGTATQPKYGCDQSTCYVNSGNGLTYPTQVVNGNNISYLYGIIPGYQKGKIINPGQGNTDTITVAYSDTTFLLDCYQATVASSTTITFVDPQSLSPKVAYSPPCSTTTNPQVLPQSVTDPAVGLKVGDLVYFTGTTTSGVAADAVLEVTNTSGAASPYTVTFGDPDALKLNQTGATSGNLASIVNATGTVNRIWVITYYLDVPASTGLPTLMRQINGQSPTPVAENVSDLEFSYEVYDDTKTPPQSTSRDANLALGGSPSLIKKVNILHLTMRSALAGSQGYQGFDVHTAVSARNLGIHDQFPLN